MAKFNVEKSREIRQWVKLGTVILGTFAFVYEKDENVREVVNNLGRKIADKFKKK